MIASSASLQRRGGAAAFMALAAAFSCVLPARLEAQRTGPVQRPTRTPLAALPAAPSSVTASQTSASEIKVTWPAVEGAVKYFIGRAVHNEGFRTIYPSDPAATTYIDRQVRPGAKHVYTVAAIDASGRAGRRTQSNELVASGTLSSDPGSVAADTTPTGSGVVPANFGVQTYGGGTILDFRWSPVTGAKYKIVRALASDGRFAEVPGMQYANNSWARDYNTVRIGETYLYKLRAVYPDQSSAESQVLRVTINPKLAGVSNLRATSPEQGTVVLTWTPAPGAESYSILRGKGSEPMDAIKVYGSPLRLSGMTSRYTDTGLLNNTRYRYTVTTTYGPNRGGEPAGVSVTTAP